MNNHLSCPTNQLQARNPRISKPNMNLPMTLYDMTQELAYMVYELDALLELEKTNA